MIPMKHPIKPVAEWSGDLLSYSIYRYVMDNNGGTSYGGGSYHEFTDFIDAKEIETVLELGSRDGLDAIWLSCIFDAVVYAWECHPGLKESMVTMTKHFENVHFVDKAVWSEETTIDFHIVTNGNVGASSCFEVDDSNHFDLEQTKITVDAIRLDDWANKNNVASIDLLAMDLQGAELEALKGAGDLLNTVKYIITEGALKPHYKGAPHIDEITNYLKGYGFKIVADNIVSADSLEADFLFQKI